MGAVRKKTLRVSRSQVAPHGEGRTSRVHDLGLAATPSHAIGAWALPLFSLCLMRVESVADCSL